MDEQRKAARSRQRRIIYNNDGDDVIETNNRYGVMSGLMTRTDGELIDDFLQARTAPLVEKSRSNGWPWAHGQCWVPCSGK